MPVDRRPHDTTLTDRFAEYVIRRTALAARWVRSPPVASAGRAESLVEPLRHRVSGLLPRRASHRVLPDVFLYAGQHNRALQRQLPPTARRGSVERLQLDAEYFVRGASRPPDPASAPLGGASPARISHHAATDDVLHGRLPQSTPRKLGAAVPDFRHGTRRRLERLCPAGRHALGHRAQNRGGNRSRGAGGGHVGVQSPLRRSVSRGDHRPPLSNPRRRRARTSHSPADRPHLDRLSAAAAAIPGPAAAPRRTWSARGSCPPAPRERPDYC